MNNEQFKVKSLPNELKLNLSNSDILAFQLTFSFDDAEKMSTASDWLFERIQVNIANEWMPLKEKGINEYHPANISVVALKDILFYVLNFLKGVFQNSNELSQEQ